MLLMADTDYFVAEFRRITAGLKKRLLRKPNLQEVVEGYGSLSKKMASEELPQYAALCSMAMAKAEKGMKNLVGEAVAWHDAGRLFLQAEDSLHDLLIPSYKDHLIAAVQCYLIAIEVHVANSKSSLAATLSLEIATALLRYEDYSEALRFYHKAAELLADEEDGGYYHAVELAVTCRLKLRDYQGVLKDISGITQKIRKKINPRKQDHLLLQKCEVTQFLIILILQPPKNFLSTEYSQLLIRYSADVTSDDYLEPHMDENIFIILQSLKIAIDQKDEDAKPRLKDELWPHLTSEQQKLLTLLIKVHDPHEYVIL
ncbi:40-kDa huntingtin-associated protein-like [Dysidea avara]|uniref:40-kDa huntingtin-associated protein-like n=1 Tax=Dysidea avara TaxID=196820 RepID=UPI003333D2AE